MKKENDPEIDGIIDELKRLSSEILELNPPVEAGLVKRFEEVFQVELPDDYKYLISKVNGFSLMRDDVYGISYEPLANDLVEIYQFEHFYFLFLSKC